MAAAPIELEYRVVDHLIGKPRTSLEVEPGESFQQMLAGALVLSSGEPAHPVTLPELDD